MKSSDRQILDAVWADFQRHYWVPLQRWAKRNGLSDMDAEQIANEAMFTWWMKGRDFEHRGQGSFRAWLRKVVEFKSHELRRKGKANRVAYFDPAAGLADFAVDHGSPALQLELRELEEEAAKQKAKNDQAFERAVDVVRQHYANRPASKAFQAWELRVKVGLSAKEAAVKLGYAKENTIDVYKNRIEAKIREVSEKLIKAEP